VLHAALGGTIVLEIVMFVVKEQVELIFIVSAVEQDSPAADETNDTNK